MNRHLVITLFIASLVVSGIACETGQILTPEEATQAAEATREAQLSRDTAAATSGEFDEGQMVEFVGVEFLIGLAEEPGLNEMVTHVSRGDTGTVLGVVSLNDVVWYQVDTDAGTGWVVGKSLEALAASVEGIDIGGQAALAGREFLIALRPSPGSPSMIAGQERGVVVTILEVQVVDGVNWYKIDAPTGEGWVPANNLEPIETETEAEGEAAGG